MEEQRRRNEEKYNRVIRQHPAYPIFDISETRKESPGATTDVIDFDRLNLWICIEARRSTYIDG